MPLCPADVSKLSRLLDEGMDMAPAQVEPWLAALPPDVAHLVPALRRMLGERPSRGAADFLDQGPQLDDLPLAHGDGIWPGRQIGPHRVLRELGAGGMGTVWLAQRVDGRLNRLVALKLPRLAWGAGLGARMARERDIGALLEHPHIARLYDAGVDELGRPFLAFEYIDGVDIGSWCRTRALPVRERLQLFLQVASAVAYAHGRLVVHRDLKPANVLVTADAQVHLLDFGIAKRLREDGPGEPGLTQQLGPAMTPHYASPEQLRGEPVAVASDIYSLGVLLYELLCGHRPHELPRASPLAQEAAIMQAELPPASRRAGAPAVARALRGDLDAILAKALSRDPAQRYATVDALADDLQRHLAGEPVRARPPSAAYQLGRLVARHRMATAAGAMVALAAAIGAAVVFEQAQRAREEAEQAELVKQFVIDAFRASTQFDAQDDPGLPVSLERLLERSAPWAAGARTPRLQAELHGIVASLLLDAGSFEQAAGNARRQIGLLESLGAAPESRAAATLLLSRALLEAGLGSEAETEARRALELAPPGSDLADRARQQLGRARDARQQVSPSAPAR